MEFNRTETIFGHGSKLVREVVEAYAIEKMGERAISEASVSMTDQERRLLDKRLGKRMNEFLGFEM